MKIEHEHAMKLLGRMAIALALTAGASAQRLAEPHGMGSLANDIREGRGPRTAPTPVAGGMIRVDLPQEPELEIFVEVISQLDDGGLGGLFPGRSDLAYHLRLAGGVSGSIALIEVELAGGATVAGSARRTLAHGVFGPDGVFEVDLPAGLDAAGFAVRGAMLSGHVVTETVAVELEPAADEIYRAWEVLGRLDDPRGAHRGGSFQRARRGHVDPRPIR